MKTSSLVRLGLLALLALALAAGRLWWSEEDGIRLQSAWGYWLNLVLLLFAGGCFLRVASRLDWFRWDRWATHRLGLAVVAAGTVFLHVHEPHVMRVFYDEPAQAACALSMHLDKQAAQPVGSNYLGDVFVLGVAVPPFRQYLYPMLVSLVHDFTGYRLANLFVVNLLLTPVVLLAAYGVGCRLTGRTGGVLAAGLLATLPLLAQNVTGGGYDVLSLALLGCLIFFTIEYATAEPANRAGVMDLSLATALLLAVSRYEAVLYLLPWALVTLMLWLRERRVHVTAFAVVSPVFLLPNLWAGSRLVKDSANAYADILPGGAPFFSLGYLPDNLGQALYFFFHGGTTYTNSLALSVLGAAGLVVLAVTVPGAWRRAALDPRLGVFALFALFVGGVYLFMLTMFWSSPLEANTARLSLPLQFVGAVAGAWLVGQSGWLRVRPGVVAGAVAVWAVVGAAPVMSRAQVTYSLNPGRANRWWLEEAEKRERTATLFVANHVSDLIAARFAAKTLKNLNDTPDVFVRALKAGLYREILVLEEYETDRAGGWRPRRLGGPAPYLVTETLAERVFTPLYAVRIARFIGYRKPDGTVVTAASEDPQVQLKTGFATEDEYLRYRLSLYP